MRAPDHLLPPPELLRALARPLDAAERDDVGRIEQVRRELLDSDETVRMPSRRSLNEPGATTTTHRTRSVARLCEQASSGRRKATLLYKLLRVARPERVLELGTAVGISGAYFASALRRNGSGALVTIEGIPAIADVARTTFDRLGLDDVEVVTGRFQERLAEQVARLRPDLVFVDGHHDEHATREYFAIVRDGSAPGALVVLDDTAWSAGMRRAWRTVRRDPAVQRSAGLHRCAVLRLR